MTKERWNDIISDIKDKFEVIDMGTEHSEEEGGVQIEYISFKNPIGEVRLELITKPVVLDKKVMYSNRIGAESNITYIYSETDFQSHFMAYRWNSETNDWEELKELSPDSF
ncbi:hypothetical protein ISS03_03000 [Patescibacteria group bacterium]|nr:hypothetical protein [Patescibacteria group bacterium]